MKTWTMAWTIILVGALSAMSPAEAEERIEPVLTDDGLYTQEWFLQSFLDLSEDLETAASSGKRFAILWELKGCPYCKDMHEINLADPEINAYIRDNFEILQLNFEGSRLVTDFDGEELEERDLRQKYGVRFSPTLQFFPESNDEIAGETGQAAETMRMSGYTKPDKFTAMFHFIKDKAYDQQTFQEFLSSAGNG